MSDETEKSAAGVTYPFDGVVTDITPSGLVTVEFELAADSCKRGYFYVDRRSDKERRTDERADKGKDRREGDSFRGERFWTDAKGQQFEMAKVLVMGARVAGTIEIPVKRVIGDFYKISTFSAIEPPRSAAMKFLTGFGRGLKGLAPR